MSRSRDSKVNKMIADDNLQDAFADQQKQKKQRSQRASNKKFHRNGNKPKSKRSQQYEPTAVSGAADANDAEWYIPNQQIANDIGNISTSLRSGTSIPLDNGVNSAVQSVPGILTYYYLPTFGDQNAASDALNSAAQALAVEVRRSTSGTTYWDKNDLMVMLLAEANLLAYYAYLVRAYGMLSEYSSLNKYTPDALLEAMGISSSDLIQNIANFRAWINNFAYRIQSLYIPKTISYFKRTIWLCENIYKDAESPQAQYYMYNPIGFYQFEETSGSGTKAAGHLIFKTLPYMAGGSPGRMMGFSDLKQFGESLLEPLWSSDSTMFMTADLIKALGPNAAFTIAPIAENFRVVPVYNREVLMQMENAYVYNYNAWSLSLNQVVSLSELSLQPSYNFAKATSAQTSTLTAYAENYTSIIPTQRRLLNFHGLTAPTPQDVLVATRLTGFGDMMYVVSSNQWTDQNGVAHSDKFQPITMGTEIIAQAILYEFVTQKSGDIMLTQTPVFSDYLVELDTGTTTSATTEYISATAKLPAFDWHFATRPIMVTKMNTDAAEVFTDYAYTFDFDVYGVIDRGRMLELNSNSILAMFTKGLTDRKSVV